MLRSVSSVLTAVLAAVVILPVHAEEHSVFYPTSMVTRARENAARDPWAGEIRKEIIAAAGPWLKLNDAQLWDLMFGATITRSWMVWSSGHCPACKQGVPMYNWRVDCFAHPWKLECPNCHEFFPKNDFPKYYQSGLDEHGVFDPKLADQALLLNTEHPEASDPLHKFGVDDGNGYVEGDKRWRFIGTYLVYGQWKQAVVQVAVEAGGLKVVAGETALLEAPRPGRR
jgi:hypothetical protein